MRWWTESTSAYGMNQRSLMCRWGMQTPRSQEYDDIFWFKRHIFSWVHAAFLWWWRTRPEKVKCDVGGAGKPSCSSSNHRSHGRANNCNTVETTLGLWISANKPTSLLFKFFFFWVAHYHFRLCNTKFSHKTRDKAENIRWSAQREAHQASVNALIDREHWRMGRLCLGTFGRSCKALWFKIRFCPICAAGMAGRFKVNETRKWNK